MNVQGQGQLIFLGAILILISLSGFHVTRTLQLKGEMPVKIRALHCTKEIKVLIEMT